MAEILSFPNQPTKEERAVELADRALELALQGYVARKASIERGASANDNRFEPPKGYA